MDIEIQFTGGRMEKDADERFIKDGLYRDAVNIRVLSSDGSDTGALENVQGNVKKTDIKTQLGGGVLNFNCLYAYANEVTEKVYFWVQSPTLEGIIEYNVKTSKAKWVLYSD